MFLKVELIKYFLSDRTKVLCKFGAVGTDGDCQGTDLGSIRQGLLCGFVFRHFVFYRHVLGCAVQNTDYLSFCVCASMYPCVPLVPTVTGRSAAQSFGGDFLSLISHFSSAGTSCCFVRFS